MTRPHPNPPQSEEGEMSNINACANKALTAAPRALPADEIRNWLDNSGLPVEPFSGPAGPGLCRAANEAHAHLITLLQQNARLTTALAEAENTTILRDQIDG